MASSSADLTEQYAYKQLSDSTAKILDNLGFVGTSSEALNMLTDVMRHYLEGIFRHGKRFMEHGGRNTFDLGDIENAFQQLQLNSVELFEYMDRVGPFERQVPDKIPQIPIPPSALKTPVLPRLSIIPEKFLSTVPPTEKEVQERLRNDNHIPPHFPTLIHEKNTKDSAIKKEEPPKVPVTIPEPVFEPKTTKNKLKDDFPLFDGNASSLGVIRKTPVVVSRFDRPLTPVIEKSITTQTKKIKSKEHINHTSGVKSARASPVPLHSVTPSTSNINMTRKVESSPNLKALENRSIKLTLMRNENKKRSISPLVTGEQRHVYDDIPRLEPARKENESNCISLNDFNAPTPEYRLNEENDDSSQPPLLPIISAKRKDKILKERRKKAKSSSSKSALANEPPVLEPIVVQATQNIQRTPSPVTGTSPICTLPLRIKIKDLNSNSPSASYSMEKIVANATPPHVADLPPRDSDSDDTIPMVQTDEPSSLFEGDLQTSFPLNITLNSETIKPINAASQDKVKLEADNHKEHKKKKKKDKDKDRLKDKKHEKDEKRHSAGSEKKSEEKLAPLKIKLLSPTTSDPPATPSAEQPIAIERTEPLRIRLKPVQKEDEEKPLPDSSTSQLKRMGVVAPIHIDKNSNRPRVKTKAELKAPPELPPLFSVDTTIIRPVTPKNRSSTSTPVPPVARDSPVPPLTLKLTKEKDKHKHEKIDKSHKKDSSISKKDEIKKEKKKSLDVIKPIEPAEMKPKKEKKDKVHVTKSPKEKNVQLTNGVGADEQVWICPICSVAYTEGADMVCCDACDEWYHWTCVGITVEPPKEQLWFCDKCTKKKSQVKAEKRKSSASVSSSHGIKKRKYRLRQSRHF